jgi:energy-coupling factor transporter ATP-binding protein EcfA2
MPANNAMILADQQKMQKVLENARMYIDRDYLGTLSSYGTSVEAPRHTDFSSVRIIRLNKIVYNSEDVQSKLLSVFNTISGVSDACFILIRGSAEKTELFLGLRSDNSATMGNNALQSSIIGNFPGTEFESLSADGCKKLLHSLTSGDGIPNTSVVSVSQVPSERNSDIGEPFHPQGIEHFIDAMKGRDYTAVIFASPLSTSNAASQRNNMENLYSSLSALKTLSYQYGETITVNEQHSLTESISENISNTVSQGYSFGTMQNSGTSQGGGTNIHVQFNSMGLGYGMNTSSFQSSGTQQTQTNQQSLSTQKGTQRGHGYSSGTSEGQSKGVTITQTNKTVNDLLDRIDHQISRIRECETYGLWECCAYFTAPSPDVALVAANIYKALSCGPNSGSEKSFVNKWDPSNTVCVKNILSSLANARMPVFRLPGNQLCNAGSIISGRELPLLMSFPLRSVCGVTVIQMASFGRDVYRAIGAPPVKRKMNIGKIFHMGRVEETFAGLDIDSFASHALITGTTGVGKSTLVSMLLSALHDIGVKLLIVEPAKGEYKDLIGGIPGIQVFTTNPQKNRMLRINPFEFREGVHVLTHIDRLIDVFSVCWPLYAAQPALLRECIEEAYIRTGWDLSNSVFVHNGPKKYPDFRLLLKIVPEIINKSHFVGESKGTYEGALLTRIAMLTHGIFGQVFNSSVSLHDEELFDRDTIIDLSDVGSQETISLLMGIMVVRLREYRTSKSKPQNQELHHVMVLEEAHNIFQRSTSKGVEGGESISGKSVQMLSGCIAEMRGYGQGIFIVDQSPSEIDLSGIRNTATKIVMRQCEAADQTAMAESLSLTPPQTAELSRLPKQVALVYQTDWIEPIMIKVNPSKQKYKIDNNDTISYSATKQVRGELIKSLLLMEKSKRFDILHLSQKVRSLTSCGNSKKQDYIALFEAYNKEYRYISEKFSGPKTRIPFFSRLITELLACEDFFRLCPFPALRKNITSPYSRDPLFIKDCESWKSGAVEYLDRYAFGLTAEEKDRVLQLILLNDQSNSKQILVHNALFGKIGANN